MYIYGEFSSCHGLGVAAIILVGAVSGEYAKHSHGHSSDFAT